LINNSIKFAASGKSLSGASNTGLYFSLSQYYDNTLVATVEALSYFGTFEVRGQLSCYDKVHIVASSPAIDTLTDAYLSNWSCSVHEAFSAYPSVGINGFQAIAIADGVVFPGTQTYGDGHSGLPYIITRGATPAGCGDGKWDGAVGEECDDGNVVDGDGCSKSCKCESGLPKGDGTCFPSNTTIQVQPSGSVKPSGYTNSSSTV
jgi:cysteine-rich repeat protein